MSDWREITLGDEIELAYGKPLPAHTRQPGRFGVFGSNGIVGTHVEACVEGPGIVVGRKGSVGEITYCSDAFWPIDTTYYVVNKGKHNWRFLYHLLCHYDLTGLNSHSAVPGLNRDDAYSIAVMLPQRGEQDDIASVLDCLENSIHLETDALANAQELKRAAMGKLFTRGLRGEPRKETEIGLVPESWEIVPLNAICGATDQVDLNTDGGRRIHYIDVSCVSRESLAVITTNEYVLRNAPGRARKRVRAGDVIFATIRPTLRRVSRILPELDNQICSTAFCVLRTEEPDGLGKFVYYAVQRPEFVDLLARIETGASYPAVTDRQVKSQLIPLPSQEEREQIVAILDAIDRKIELHRKKRAVLEELFKALLHKLMTGEIRVTDLDLSALADAPARHEDVVA